MEGTNNYIFLTFISISTLLLSLSFTSNAIDLFHNGMHLHDVSAKAIHRKIKKLCRVAYEPPLCVQTVSETINPVLIDPDTVLYTELNITQDETGQAMMDSALKVVKFTSIHRVTTNRYKKCTSLYYAALEELLAAEEAFLARDMEKVNALVGKAITFWRKCNKVFHGDGLGSPLSDQNSYLERLARNCMTLGRAVKQQQLIPTTNNNPTNNNDPTNNNPTNNNDPTNINPTNNDNLPVINTVV